MIRVSLMSILLSAFSAHAALSLEPVLHKIKERSCASALSGVHKPLLLVVGLGNYGYDGTRHNVGDETVNRLEMASQATSEVLPEQWIKYFATDDADAERYMEFTAASSPKRDGLTIEYRIGGRVAIPAEDSGLSNVVFVHPYYDINESGHFVSQVVKELGLPIEQLLVFVDDITLARNQIVLSKGKSDGTGDGHNGLKSINARLGNGSYYRLRVGVSNPKTEKVEVSRTDWVLGATPGEDLAVLFSPQRVTGLQNLLINLQARSLPDANQGKLVGEGSAILKQLNSK